MAAEQLQNVATRGELYGTAASLCVLLFMVLIASSKAEDHWLRIFTMFFVVGFQLFYVGMSIWLRNRPARDETKVT